MRALDTARPMALMLTLALGGCSAVIDSDQYTGGDRDGGTDNPQQQLLDVRAARVQAWCECFAGFWGFRDGVEQCVASLNGGSEYDACALDGFDDADESSRQIVDCQLQAAQEASECEEAAACDPVSYTACHDRYTEALLGCEFLHTAEQVACAQEHVVGPAGDACPLEEDAFDALPTILGWNKGAGDDYEWPDGCLSRYAGADIPFTWTPAEDGAVIIDTVGSTYDPSLVVVDDCDNQDVLACNDDIDPGRAQLQSRVRVAATGGEPLTVVVDAFSAADFGAFRVNFTTLHCVDEPDNASSDTGAAVFEGNFETVVDGSDMEPLTDDCIAADSGPEVAFAWRAPQSGTFVVDTAGSSFDTVLYARKSCDPHPDPENAYEVCNDDASGLGDASRIEVSVMRDETIILVLDSKETLAGTYQININPG
ncbi:MAG: hypothetical protein ACOC97_04475 [Myxococcota bacterium]